MKNKKRTRNKILYYEPSSGYGGSSRCLREWLKEIDIEKFEPVVAVIDNGPVIKEIEKLGIQNEINVYKIKKKKNNNRPSFVPDMSKGYLKLIFYLIERVIPLSIRLIFIIKKEKIDLVHINTTVITGLEGIIAGKITAVPTICHLHEFRRLSLIEKVFEKWVDKFICLTEKAKENYGKQIRISKLERVYNGIKIKNAKECKKKNVIRDELGLKIDENVVGIVGRFTWGKGFRDFIEAAYIVAKKIDSVKFLIVGDVLSEREEVYKSELKDMVKKKNMQNEVIFTGWREDAFDVIGAMDILVQASSTFPEGFGLTCIEGMLQKIPVVVTNIPGPSEIVVNQHTGIIVEPGNVEEIAKAIVYLLRNMEIARNMGIAGREYVEKMYDIKNTVKNIQNIYEKLLLGRRKIQNSSNEKIRC